MGSQLILIGSDHVGFALKERLKTMLQASGYTVEDAGTHDTERCDYPDIAQRLSRRLLAGAAACGILVCGSGVGMSIAANRIPGIRAALCAHEYVAQMARRHNDANVLCLGARVVGADLAERIVTSFLTAAFEGGRHAQRVALLETPYSCAGSPAQSPN